MAKGYTGEKIRSGLFHGFCALVLLVILATLGFMIYAITLRTVWHDHRTELNSDFAEAYTRGAEISCGDLELAMTDADLDYFHRFLYQSNTVIYRMGDREATERSITLSLPEGTLVFTPLEDGERIHLQWSREEETRGYYFKGYVDYSHLESYFGNCVRNAQLEP